MEKDRVIPYRHPFVHITGNSKNNLFALDSDGNVWRYVPAEKASGNTPARYAFWTKLTSHRRDPADAPKDTEADTET